MYTRDTFNLKDRIIGATRHSIILKGDDGEPIFCHNRVFGKIMTDPYIQFEVRVLPGHESPRDGRYFDASKWIVAYLPSRCGFGI